MAASVPTIAPAIARRQTLLRAALCGALLVALAGSLAPAARAGGAAHAQEEVWMTVADSELDTLRGGFEVGSGLMVSFGITRAVYINGELVTQTTLNLGQLDQITAAQAGALGAQLAALNIVQNGPNNAVESQVGGLALGTIIQNSLNDQHIANMTVIDARTNSMEMIKGLNTLSTLTDSLAGAIGN